jgi:hypothetical protein
MLVFAGAGLDAAVKRLIQDTLPGLVRKKAPAREALQAFAARRIRDEAATGAESAKAYSLIAIALVSDSPQAAIIRAFVEELTGGSLQSVDRVFEALGALGLQKGVTVDRSQLKQVFDDRNRIVHEMDMDLTLSNRRRTSRRRDPMIASANALLTLGAKILEAVDQGLS